MPGIDELHKDYEKLRSEYPELPPLEDFVKTMGYPETEDTKSVLRLFLFTKKSPGGTAQWIGQLLASPNPICSHDKQFMGDMQNELLDAMRISTITNKDLSLVSFEAPDSEDMEGAMAEAINKAVSDMQPVVETLKKFIEKTREGWAKSTIGDDEVSYRW